jgi:hypothetical protein
VRASGDRYVPLDEWLERPRIKLLRALRWMDWTTSGAAYLAIGVPDFDRSENRDRDRYVSALSHLVRAGQVERRRVSWQGLRARASEYEYRITDRGRAELRGIAEVYARGLEVGA